MRVRPAVWLILIFLATLLFHLFFVFSTPHFSSPTAYYHLRVIDHLTETKTPMTYDPLSYGGRPVYFPPGLYVLLALFSPLPFAYKVLPALSVSSLVVLVYLFARKVTPSATSALFAALMAGILPILVSTTLNTFSLYAFLAPLIIYFLYTFTQLEHPAYQKQFIALSFLLPFLHPIAFLIALALAMYIFLMSLESLQVDKFRKEGILFFLFLGLFIQSLFYKQAFIELGWAIIWQNIPSQVLAQHFTGINLLEAVYLAGILPFVLGILAVILGLSRKTDRKPSLFVLSSLILSTGLLMALKLLPFSIGLLFLALALTIASALTLEKLYKYLQLTKFSTYRPLLTGLLLLLILLTVALPAVLQARATIAQALTPDEVEALNLLRRDSDPKALVLSTAEEGHLITGIAQRKSFQDTYFLYIPHIDRRYADAQRIYTTQSGVKALEILHQYGISYIYVSPKAKSIYNIQSLSYVHDSDCFRRISKVGAYEVYKVRC